MKFFKFIETFVFEIELPKMTLQSQKLHRIA